jgi:hypothetical protein
MVNLKVDQGQLNGAKLMLAAVGKSADPIIYRAINKTIDNTQVKAVDMVYQVLNLTKTRIRKDFKKSRAYRSRLSGQLLAEGLPVGFMSFSGTKELKGGKGVSVKLKRKGSREHFRHAFIADAKGGTHVFEREDWGSGPWYPGYPYFKMPRRYRFGLDRLSSVTIEDYYKDDRIYKTVIDYGGDRLVINIGNQIDFELGKI